jgi:hypothetical protein
VIAALSPTGSWVVVVLLIVIALLIYAYIDGSARFDAMEHMADDVRWQRPEPPLPWEDVTVRRGPYDWQIGDDFAADARPGRGWQ